MRPWIDVWVSPSDFVYLLSDCPRCWWLKSVARILRPKEGMPEIFNKIDGAMKLEFREEGGGCSRLLRRFGIHGRIIPNQNQLKSKKIEFPEFRVRITVGGYTDEIVELWDDAETGPTGEYGILDHKTTMPSDYKAMLFQRQLNGYAYAMECPASGDPRQVSLLGLFVFKPESFNAHDPGREAQLKGSLSYLPVELARPMFDAQLAGIAELAAQPKPPLRSDRCPYCLYASEVLAFAKRLKEGESE